MAESEDQWFVYMVICRDQTLYTGITKDLEKRLAEHNNNLYGAKYTRYRRPVQIVYREKHPSRSAATKRELDIKKMSRAEKLQLVRGLST